jgi:uncharacterized protein YdhG (YjbR/CyaY superfamily)
MEAAPAQGRVPPLLLVFLWKETAMSDDKRISQLVEAGVAKNAEAFSPKAKTVIGNLSDEEFNSVLSIRRQIIAVASREDVAAYDQCLSFIF